MDDYRFHRHPSGAVTLFLGTDAGSVYMDVQRHLRVWFDLVMSGGHKFTDDTGTDVGFKTMKGNYLRVAIGEDCIGGKWLLPLDLFLSELLEHGAEAAKAAH